MSRLILKTIFILFIIASSSLFADTELPYADKVEALYDFVQGEFILIGRAPDGRSAYTGTMTIRSTPKQEIIRVIGKKTVTGTWKISDISHEGALGLKIQFTDTGKSYEGIYQVNGDMDNYPRLTGEVYLLSDLTKAPALEAMFAKSVPVE